MVRLVNVNAAIWPTIRSKRINSPGAAVVCRSDFVWTVPMSQHRDDTIELKGIVKRYGGVTVFDDVDFRVKTGEAICLAGEMALNRPDQDT